MQPADILVFSRKMLNTIVFPPNFEFNRKLSTKMLPPDGIQLDSPAGPRPSKAPGGGDGSAKIDNAATAAKNAILAFVASSLGEGDFRLNLDMDYKKSVSNCNPIMAWMVFQGMLL